MTDQGGANNAGTVFRYLTPAGAKTVLYGSFSRESRLSALVFLGSLPGGDLIQASDGNFFRDDS